MNFRRPALRSGAALPPGVGPEDRVVLFDGECVMCSAGAQALIRVDRKAAFKLGTTQSPEGKQLLAWHGLSVEAPDTFVLSEGANLYVRSSAYVRILWRLDIPLKALGAVLWLVPRPIRDAAYNWVAGCAQPLPSVWKEIRLYGTHAGEPCASLGAVGI